MWGYSSAMPSIAERRRQTAARSMPSNHPSTQGRVLIRTSATLMSSTDSAPNS
jgi:hypothetical protein